MSFVDLDNLEVRRNRNVEPIYLTRTIVAAGPVPAQNVVLVQHDQCTWRYRHQSVATLVGF